jgi:hypothetical protein
MEGYTGELGTDYWDLLIEIFDYSPLFIGSYMTYGQVLGSREHSLCVQPEIERVFGCATDQA